jgi:hypothetical protein
MAVRSVVSTVVVVWASLGMETALDTQKERGGRWTFAKGAPKEEQG